MPFMSANGINICYQTDGQPSDTPLLLIMGLGMQLTAWPQALVDLLVAGGFYVIRFDNRDSGLSSKMGHFGKPNLPFAFVKTLLRLPLRSPYKLTDMAADSVAVLDELGVAQAHVVGASMGGMIAQTAVAQFPNRFLSLTSIMSTSGRSGLPGPSLAARKAILSRPKKPYQKEQVLDQIVRTFQIIGSPAYPTPEAELRQRIGLSMERCFYPEGTARQMVAIAASGSRTHLLRKLQLPSLVIHGANDPLIPLACGQDTAKQIPNSQLRVFEGMGHDLPAPLLPEMAAMIEAVCRQQAIPAPRTFKKTA